MLHQKSINFTTIWGKSQYRLDFEIELSKLTISSQLQNEQNQPM